MRRFLARLRARWLDIVIVAVPLAGALACWVYALPVWMLVSCLIAAVIAIVALLGELGLFGDGSRF